MGDMASAAAAEDVWNAACVSAGAEEGRRPVAESGRGDGWSRCATDTELFIDAEAERRRIRVSHSGWPPAGSAVSPTGDVCVSFPQPFLLRSDTSSHELEPSKYTPALTAVHLLRLYCKDTWWSLETGNCRLVTSFITQRLYKSGSCLIICILKLLELNYDT